MANDCTITHADGTTFTDGSGYAPTDILAGDEWPAKPSLLTLEHQVSALARAILILAEGRRPTAAMKRFVQALATGQSA